jgi:hypothetical protein
MESKTVSELIEYLGIEPHTCHLGCPGVFYLETVEYIAEEFSDQQNATVIEQNRKLREALKEMDEAFDTPGVVNDFWLRKLIKDTLKETEHEK